MLEKEPAHLVVKERTSRGINAGININMARIRRVKAAAAAEEIKSADRCRAGRSMQAHRSPRTTTMFTDIDCAQDNYARAGSFSAPGHTFCWSSARQNTPPAPWLPHQETTKLCTLLTARRISTRTLTHFIPPFIEPWPAGWGDHVSVTASSSRAERLERVFCGWLAWNS